MSIQKVNFDNYVNEYNELLRKDTNFFSNDEKYFAEYKINILKNQSYKNPKKILEFGCGIGRNIKYLSDAFPNSKIFGSDVSSASLDMAQMENPSTYFFLEEGIQSQVGSYDLIFVAGVFHHIPVLERPMAMKSIFDRLENNGEIFIFEHNPYNPITRRIVNNCPFDVDAILIKKLELIDLLVDAGFIVQNQAYCLFIPPILKRISLVERFISWLPLGGQYWVKAKKLSS